MLFKEIWSDLLLPLNPGIQPKQWPLSHACQSAESGSKYVQHDENNPLIDWGGGQEGPTDNVTNFFATKLLFVD